MRTFILFALGTLLSALGVACGPGKELPDAVVPAKEQPTIQPDPGGKAPEKSDPVAKAIVEKAINAITQGKPEILAKARVSVLKAHGSISLQKPRMTDGERTVQAVWPDRLHIYYKFNDSMTPPQTWGFYSPVGWTTSLSGITPTTLGQYIQTNLMAEHWLLLGLGLSETGEVFFAPKKEKQGKVDVTTIKISLPERPIYTASFDDKTGLPVRIEYSPSEIGSKLRVNKAVQVTENMESGGFKLPAVFETYLNGELGEQWKVQSWEFPEKLPNDLFTPPK